MELAAANQWKHMNGVWDAVVLCWVSQFYVGMRMQSRNSGQDSRLLLSLSPCTQTRHQHHCHHDPEGTRKSQAGWHDSCQRSYGSTLLLLFSRSALSDSCDPMDCTAPGFSVLHHLLESAQTHVHWVSDAIQSSRPLLSPSPPAFNLSQHQGLFQWVGSSHQHSTPHENCQECWRENSDRGSPVSQFNMGILVNSQHDRHILMTTSS